MGERPRLRVEQDLPSAEVSYVRIGDDMLVVAVPARLRGPELQILLAVLFTDRSIDPHFSTFSAALRWQQTCTSSEEPLVLIASALNVTMEVDRVGILSYFTVGSVESLNSAILVVTGPLFGSASVEFQLDTLRRPS